MSQETPDASHQKCKLLSDNVVERCAVISAESSATQVPSRKKREEAKQTLYLNRV